MPSGPGERYDFFLSRRGSVASVAQEITEVLTEKGYKVLVQDYDMALFSIMPNSSGPEGLSSGCSTKINALPAARACALRLVRAVNLRSLA